MQISIDTSRDSKEEIKRVIRLLQEITGDTPENYQQNSGMCSSSQNIFESSSSSQDKVSSGMMNFFDTAPSQQTQTSEEALSEEVSTEASETITIVETDDDSNGDYTEGDSEIPTGQDGEAQKIIESDSILLEESDESKEINQPEENDILGNPLSKREKPKKFKSGVITY